jgi:hypothetical protein
MDLSEIGRQFGLNEEQTRAAVEALTPVVAAGMRRNGGTGGGLNDIIKSITQGGHRKKPRLPPARAMKFSVRYLVQRR